MSTTVDPNDSTAFLYDEAAGPKNLTMGKRTLNTVVDGTFMGVGILIASTLIRKVDKKMVPESSKVSGTKIIGGCVVASAIIQVLKSYNIIPSTYGHVVYRYNNIFS